MIETKHKPMLLILSLGGTWNARRNKAGKLEATPLLGDFSPADLFTIQKKPPDGAEFQRNEEESREPPRQKVVPLFEEQLDDLCVASGYGLFGIDSSNLGPPHWTQVANYILRDEHDYDCFVVMTGTDTLAYLAPALAFALRRFGKPVIVSGAQKSRLDAGSDALFNLMNACKVALESSSKSARFRPKLQEVAVVFGSRVIRATRCRKYSERDLEAFRSMNVRDLGRIRLDVDIDLSMRLDKPEKGNRYWPEKSTGFDAEVGLLYLYPGMPPKLLDELGQYCSAIVLAAYGAGNHPGPEPSPEEPGPEVEPTRAQLDALDAIRSLADSIGELRKAGVPVVVTTQCVLGTAEFKKNTYSSGADKRKCIIVNDMLPEVALVKARWIASNFKSCMPNGKIDWHEFKRLMLRPIAGEITPTETRKKKKESKKSPPVSG